MGGPKVKTARKPLGRKHSTYALTTQFPGMPGRSAADDVIAHLQELAALGLPMRSVARATGFHQETILEMVRGKRWATVLTRNRAVLLAVTHQPTPEQGWVLTIGATRRLRALAAIGWTVTTLAAHTPLSAGVLEELMRARQVTTTYENWAAVAALFELLSGTPGPSKLARSRALAKGWNAPLDWEDIDINDPRVMPQETEQEPKPDKKAIKRDRREQVRALSGGNLTVQQIADRVGVSERTALRYLAEIRREDAA